MQRIIVWMEFSTVPMASYKNNCDYCTIDSFVVVLFRTLRQFAHELVVANDHFTHLQSIDTMREIISIVATLFFIPADIPLFARAKGNQEMFLKCRALGLSDEI